jgi:hypothetical protein
MRLTGVVAVGGSAFVLGVVLSKLHSRLSSHKPAKAPLSTEDAEVEAQTKIGTYLMHSLNAAMVYIGDNLDLYHHVYVLQKKTSGATPSAVAKATGLHERWVREWMYQQCSCDVLHRLADIRAGC